MNLDKLDRALNAAPYMLLWLAVVLVVISIASQTMMYVQRRAYAGPSERDSTVVAGNGLHEVN